MNNPILVKLFIEEDAILIEEKESINKGLKNYKLLSNLFVLHHQYIKTKPKTQQQKKLCIKENVIIELEQPILKKIDGHLRILKSFDLFEKDSFYCDNVVHQSSRINSYKNKMVLRKGSFLKKMNLKREVTTIDTHIIGKTMIENKTNSVKKLCLDHSIYLIPASSQFIYYDLNLFNELVGKIKELSNEFKFEIILMDPPYYNKSVKNSKGYETESFDIENLRMFKINDILKEGGLVCIWTTNKKKYHDYIKNVVFKSYDIELIAKLYWIKITTKNELVVSIDNKHKKPYEILLVGRKNNSTRSENTAMEKFIYSIPVQIHSKKPILFDYLQQFVEEKQYGPASSFRYMELFSRNLYPNTLSIGNECLKFQNIEYYERCI